VQYTTTNEFYIFNLQLCAKISTNGLYFLVFKLPHLRGNERVQLQITIDSFRDNCEELIALYENCISNGEPIPLMKSLPAPNNKILDMLKQGVLLYLDELINCFKIDQGRKIAPDLICKIFELLKVASKADERIASTNREF